MEFVSSISRSSGLESGGDALKEPKVQEEYRTFIQAKLQHYWSQYPLDGHLTDKSSDSQRNLQSNILIQFRKLREGLISSKRVDDFALEVYETSLHLSVLFRTPAQTTSIVNQLIPHGSETNNSHTKLVASYGVPSTDLLPNGLNRISQEHSTPVTTPQRGRRGRQIYRPQHTRREQGSHLTDASSAKSPVHHKRWQPHLRSNSMSTALISVFHTLVYSYPLQSAYHSTLYCYRQTQLSEEEDATDEIFRWLKSIATAVASRNYVRFERLTCSNEVDRVLHRLGPLGSHRVDPQLEMRRLAVKCLIEDLRSRVRGTAWNVLAVAYRELDTTRSADWLLQSLLIHPILKRENPQAFSSARQCADSWLEQRGEKEARRKEGFEGGWILCRQRI